ncbi:MAG: helix-turn-helix domain-containing protein [Proteobacteria bacterium]|nr:helix-turn-helix domain-containing protein [Pseudomonadota bacterium]
MKRQKGNTDQLADELAREFGRILRKARERRGFSQEQLARMMGISPSYYSKLERSGRRIRIGHLADWCAAMQVSPMFILKKWGQSKYGREIDKRRMSEYRRVIEEMITFGFYSELAYMMEVSAQMVNIEKLARKKASERQRKQIKLEF